MPYISTEALVVGGALLIVLALGYQYLPKHTSKSLKKKGKRKAKALVEPAGQQANEPAEVQERGKKKEKGGVGQKTPSDRPVAPSSRSQQAGPSLPTASSADGDDEDDDGTPQPPSFAAVAASSEPKPKTLAQKIAPKPRKTKVDDMLAPEDRPAMHARVMKIAQPASESPSDRKVSKFEADYESSEETSGTGTVEDDGWDVVPSKKKKPVSISLSGAASAQSTALPLSTETKIQRKNAKRAEMRKAAKAEEEAERLRRLASHRRDLERERINEIYSKGGSKKGGGGSKDAGLAGAKLDVNGKLIWE